MKHPHLVADARGPLAAWVGTISRSGGPDATSYVDQSRMAGGMTRVRPRRIPTELDAMSGGTVYFHDERGAVAHDLITHDEHVVDPAGEGETVRGLGVVAAHDGTLAMEAERGTLLGIADD